MARSALFAALQRLARAAQRAEAAGDPAMPGWETSPGRASSRRDLLRLAGAGAAGLALPRAARAGTSPRIAIVGGGIAGLTAALKLLHAGYRSWVFEANDRIGGRMHSDTTTWLNAQVSEHCGELIDSGHKVIIRLAKRYGIPLTDLIAAQPPGTTDTYFFSGEYYPVAQAERDFRPVYHALNRDQKQAGYPTTFDHYNDAGKALDETSAYDWIEQNVPGGHGSPMGRLIDVAYDIEFGAPTTQQSALNIIYLLAYQNDPKHFAIFGQSDEHYHMLGGNQQLPEAIGAALERRAPGTIQLRTGMTAIARRDDGSYLLRLSGPGGPMQVVADHVVLAIPFAVLRELDFWQAGFDERKRRAIFELGYGTNVKLQLQFDSRLWNTPGPWGLSTGESFTDLPYQNTWEVTRGQDGSTGILVDYLGSVGARVHGDPRDPAVVRGYARWFLAQLEAVYPGITALWNGRATLDVPAQSPFLRGSYSYWKVGQYTRIAGVERLPSGRCHFAGEHCSINFQGYMEGGAEEGLRAAREVIDALATG
ncbi:MAG TPA: NAD(P)/FAD-dependent oxidoreductase [Acetobacteraceae bacterium]|nr:NAD(P)/FAD-dependent oxidoreductase [Acetobacteraceae bacterium]